MRPLRFCHALRVNASPPGGWWFTLNGFDIMKNQKPGASDINSTQKGLAFRIIVCALILATGAGIMAWLMATKKPPLETKVSEKSLQVKVIRAKPEDIRVYLEGFGQAEALNRVDIAPEVAGRVVRINPDLEEGRIIPQGQLLFAIDKRDYRAAYDDARAAVIQWQTTVARLEKQFALEKKRLANIERNRDLARAEYLRAKKLFEVNQVGTRSGVEQAERVYNSAVDLADQLGQAVALFPMRIKEAQSALAAARARKVAAAARLERCQVVAPFTGRVEFVRLEKDQYVAPGQRVLTLADDSMLEIRVPLSSEEAGRWLRFSQGDHKRAWFGPLQKVACRVSSTAHGKANFWQATLDRVVDFDPKSRTLTVAVRLDARQACSSEPEGLPLVAGMFCQVKIPGRILRQAIALPREAVSFQSTVYRVVDGRLRTTKVVVAKAQGDRVFISSGLNPGDLVVVTRLVNPLENSLVKYSLAGTDKGDRS